MSTLIKMRRGTDAERQTIIPDVGEPILTTDTKRLYIGDGVTLGGNQVGGSTYIDVKFSLTQDGTDGNKLMLVNDVGTGSLYASRFYGTDSAGAKGWFLQSSIADYIGVQRSIEATNSALQLVGDVDEPGVNHLYGTDENGTRVWLDGAKIPITDFNIQNPDTIFEYDDEDNLIKVLFDDGRYEVFEYDTDFNILSETYWDAEDVPLFKYKYEYDALGKIVFQDYIGGLNVFDDYPLGSELVYNGGFEAPYSTGLADGWIKQGTYLTPFRETTDVYAGSSSQKIVVTSAVDAVSSMYNSGHKFTVAAGSWYRVQFAVKVISGIVDAIGMYYGAHTAHHIVMTDITYREWTLKTFYIRSIYDDDEAFMEFITNHNGRAATYLLDAVSVKKVLT